MPIFNPDHKVVLDQLLLGLPLVREGKMFGFPAYYAGKKLAICLYEEGVGMKLPAATVKRLLDEDKNAIPFQPYGKPKMREWVQINCADSNEYQAYLSIFQESIDYVLELQGIEKD
ncbi:MAG: hypothetical protein V2J07_08850 [Anaerolineae bacterium]|jgi:hypothetical protein|nr:hypothetical protein [Anaerolineae bacterium]